MAWAPKLVENEPRRQTFSSRQLSPIFRRLELSGEAFRGAPDDEALTVTQHPTAMGCVTSSPSNSANKPVTHPVSGGPHYPNWQLPKPFNIEPAPSLNELNKKREEFWDTSPSYGGSHEIWEVLKAAVLSAASDIETARLYLESAGIIVATPNLTTVFDERGAKYDLPRWVLITPRNVKLDQQDQGGIDASSV